MLVDKSFIPLVTLTLWKKINHLIHCYGPYVCCFDGALKAYNGPQFCPTLKGYTYDPAWQFVKESVDGLLLVGTRYCSPIDNGGGNHHYPGIPNATSRSSSSSIRKEWINNHFGATDWITD
mmetsp:Transcript_33916/g.82241  ORF Transcript_33916/g.82241 Transcript_33916/m.82241 type:complete len:121 (-) Transcript_33916:898-1260(-)